MAWVEFAMAYDDQPETFKLFIDDRSWKVMEIGMEEIFSAEGYNMLTKVSYSTRQEIGNYLLEEVRFPRNNKPGHHRENLAVEKAVKYRYLEMFPHSYGK